MVTASHGGSRALNVRGLRALDSRTLKPYGTPWDFRLAADRDYALYLIETENPDWVIGSPPVQHVALGTNSSPPFGKWFCLLGNRDGQGL